MTVDLGVHQLKLLKVILIGIQEDSHDAFYYQDYPFSALQQSVIPKTIFNT